MLVADGLVVVCQRSGAALGDAVAGDLVYHRDDLVTLCGRSGRGRGRETRGKWR